MMENMRDADMNAKGEGRPQGIHLSHIMHEMKVAAGEKTGAIEGDQDGVRMQEGFLWETALEYVNAGLTLDEAFDVSFKRLMLNVRQDVTKQLKVERDGIHMTPDGLDPATGVLESYKCTRRSLGRAKTQSDFESEFWLWMVQEKSYCYAVGVDSVKWIVLWQAGDYSKGKGTGPQVLESTATFTPEELIANWSVVLAHKKSLDSKTVES